MSNSTAPDETPVVGGFATAADSPGGKDPIGQAANRPPHLKPTPLREFGADIALHSSLGEIPAFRDPKSGLVYFDAPTEAELSHYYSTEYGKDNVAYYSVDRSYSRDYTAWHEMLIRKAIDTIGLPVPKRVHELGCSFGGLVAQLRDMGFDATGTDLNAQAIAAGQTQKGNLHIECAGHIDALRKLDRSVDLIYASHTMEHDPNLHASLRAVSRALSDNGLFYFVVPNVMYVRALLDGFVAHPWAAYPDHLFMMSGGAMPRLLDDAGLQLVHCDTSTLEQNEWMARHFGETQSNPRIMQAWTKLLSLAGFGMELHVIAARADCTDPHIQELSRLATAKAEVMRQGEVAIRDMMASATY